MVITMANVWKRLTAHRCKFYNVCKYAQPTNPTCTEDAGQYYGFGKYAGCYRTLEEKLQKRKIQRRIKKYEQKYKMETANR